MTQTKPTPGVNEDSIDTYRGNNGAVLDNEKNDVREAHEVFQKSDELVDFRTVSW